MNPYLKEENQLDELNQKTLQSYAVKADNSRRAHALHSMSADKSVRDYSADQLKKRNAGIKRSGKRGADVDTSRKALKVSWGESVEQIDELSKSTLASYAKKATKDLSTNAYLAGVTRSHAGGSDDEAVQRRNNRRSGLPKAIDRLTKESVTEPRDEYYRKVTKYLKKKHNKAEQIDELNARTLSSYIKKAAQSAAFHGYNQGGTDARHVGEPISKRPDNFNDDRKKATKRLKGIGKAVGKMTNESLNEAWTKDTPTRGTSEGPVKHVRANPEKLKSLGIDHKLEDGRYGKTHKFTHSKTGKSVHVYASGEADEHGHPLMSVRVAGGKHSAATVNSFTKHIAEAVEQVDEVSKELANRYMHSAINDRSQTDAKVFSAAKKNRDNFSLKRHDNITKLMGKSDKRTTGIGRALNRLTKEETEQIDELSRQALSNYADKSATAAVDHMVKAKEFGDAVDRIKSRGPSAVGNNLTKRARALQQKHQGIANKRTAGVIKATRKMKNEEVEQIDEISSSTLSSYVTKAKDHTKKLEADFNAGDRSDKRADTIRKRDRGISNARQKIRKIGQAAASVGPKKPYKGAEDRTSIDSYYRAGVTRSGD